MKSLIPIKKRETVLTYHFELLPHNDVWRIGAWPAGVICLVPVIPRSIQDQPVGALHVTGKSGSRCVRRERIHFKKVCPRPQLRHQVVYISVAKVRSTKI